MSKAAPVKKKYDITIEIDEEDTITETDVLPEVTIDDEDEVMIDDPVPISECLCKIPSEISVLFLSQEVRDLISTNLNIPTTVSVASWAQVADFLNSTYNAELENDENYGEEMLEQFNDLPAQLLINALEKAQRIDILHKLKEIIETGNYTRGVKDLNGISEGTTVSPRSVKFQDMSLELKYSGNNIILINHYETTEIEKVNFKWFMKNMRRNLRQDTSVPLVPLDIAKLEKEDGGNVLKKIDDMFSEFSHIVVCFNQSYLAELYSSTPEEKFAIRKVIHERTVIEFMNNKMRNKRFRCVVMPETTMGGTTDWSAVTYHYSFPTDFQDLLQRLLNKHIKLKNNTNSNTQ